MKRTLLILLLITLISTSLLAGTLAVYNSTIDLKTADISAKRFYIGVGNEDAFDIKIAPGETQEYAFEITNLNQEGQATEVDMNLSIAADFSTVYAALPGLTIRLEERGNPAVSQPAAENGQFRYVEDSAFRANQGASRTFVFVFTWGNAEVAMQTAQAGKRVDGITLYITGTQKLN
ncbi:MAG: hypothetical protein RSE58_08725 [Clostridia bacterium]